MAKKVSERMRCLRCGWCCYQLEVIIVDDPDGKFVEENLKVKHTGDRCQHLRGEEKGKYSCAIHDRRWYKKTPCATHDQIGMPGAPCRMGAYLMAQAEWQPEKEFSIGEDES